MKLSFNSKSQEIGLDGSIVGTRVILTNGDGAFYPVMLPADKIGLPNGELERLALDVIYQENFPQRSENEKLAEITENITKQKEASGIAQATLLDVVTQLYGKGILTDETTTQN